MSRIGKDDLKRGQVYEAKFQGTNIAPTTVRVTVVWVGPEDVHYRLDDSSGMFDTPIERFLEIVNK